MVKRKKKVSLEDLYMKISEGKLTDEELTIVAANILRLRTEKKEIQTEAARACGMSHPTFWKLETMPKGFNPTYPQLKAVANHFGVKVKDLFKD